VLTLVFDAVIVAIIFRHVLTAEEPTSETIFGALWPIPAGGLSRLRVSMAVATFQANAFYLDPRTNLHTVPDRFDFIYLQFWDDDFARGRWESYRSRRKLVRFLSSKLSLAFCIFAVLIAGLIGAYRPKTRE